MSVREDPRRNGRDPRPGAAGPRPGATGGTGRRNELPVGRRVAQWRVRRNMTQQQFADRIGKSKSWVDKVERGVRRLERVSSLREVADALRIDLAVLLAERPGQPDPVAVGVEGVRAALARYHVEAPARPPEVAEVQARLDHAEQSYRHARYPELLALLPGLLDAARAARADHPGRADHAGLAADALLVDGYALTALVLVKVGQAESAWLAADRAMAVASGTGDPRSTGLATVALSQALRSAGRPGAALEAAAVAVREMVPAGSAAARSDDDPLLGTLLLQAALAAAGRRDEGGAATFLDRAAAVARTVGAGAGGFGPAAVEAARVVADTALGEVTAATVRHERLIAGDGWRWLPPEHRAGHLLDAARAYALAGDPRRAGRAVLAAERTARGEVHHRPAAKDLVAVLARATAAPSELTRLAATLHVG